jgi:hypothetical protein
MAKNSTKKAKVVEKDEALEETIVNDDEIEEKVKPEIKKDPTVGIKDTIEAIRTKFGDESIMKLGEKPKVNVNAIPTGSIGLDAALGVGGMPRGRIIEIFGICSRKFLFQFSPYLRCVLSDISDIISIDQVSHVPRWLLQGGVYLPVTTDFFQVHVMFRPFSMLRIWTAITIS